MSLDGDESTSDHLFGKYEKHFPPALFYYIGKIEV